MCVSETTSKLSATIRTFSFVFVLLRAEFVLACKYVYPIEFSFLLTSPSSQFNSHPLSISVSVPPLSTLTEKQILSVSLNPVV